MREDDGNERRKDRIYTYLAEQTQALGKEVLRRGALDAFDATAIGEALAVSRANASKELNALVKERKIVKIKGKPVYYLARAAIEKKLGHAVEQDVYESGAVFRAAFADAPQAPPESGEAQIFDCYIGARDTLKNQIDQAKAAILYPPNGLHTLIVGSTGVGKTTFAEAMYRCGVESGVFTPETPFVIFNCADYADNQQLLLSQLMGHVKGAFTGADKEKEGILEKANKGVLFLDEIHRLPPEGQEMLFLIMDKGIYRKLGATKYENVRLRIIAATTENLDTAVLRTFLRRIPVIIRMPDLKEFNYHEKLELISDAFYEESKRTKLPIEVKSDVVKILLLYDYAGNIGQLRSNIQLICAKAFLEYMRFHQDHIVVCFSQLVQNMRDMIFQISDYRKRIAQQLNIEDMAFDYEAKTSREASIYYGKSSVTDKFYQNIEKNWEQLIRDHLSETEAVRTMNRQLDAYFGELFSEVSAARPSYNKEMIAKVADVKIVESIEETFDKTQLFGAIYDKKIVYGLALHINGLIQRISRGRLNLNIKNGNEIKYPAEFRAASRIAQKLEAKFFIKIPENEINYITMFLCAVRTIDAKQTIGLLLVAHGASTASSMAEVANKLLDTDHAQALDMPLTASVKDVYEAARERVKALDKGRGVLLLVDMGSLVSFAQMITEETGIETRSVDMLTSSIAVEATRQTLFFADADIDAIVANLKNLKDEYALAQDMLTLEHKGMNQHFRNNLLRILGDTLTFLDARKAYAIFDRVYERLLDAFSTADDETMRIKFVFHCAYLMERVLRGTSLDYDRTPEIVRANETSFSALRAAFADAEEFFGRTIPDTEYVFVFNMLTHMQNTSSSC